MLKEFKSFVSRGNVVDLAVGVIIGAAFGKIVGSIVDDLIMPVVGKIVGNVDFTNMYLPLSEKIEPGMALVDAKKIGAVFAYGSFLTVALNFIIISFCIFLLVKAFNALKKREEESAPPAAAPVPTREEILLTEIRDLLKSK